MAKIRFNNGNFDHPGDRKDARKKMMGTDPIVAECRTMDGTFQARVQDVSSTGVFVLTNETLTMSQEIALTFTFPQTGQTIKATGEVVRVTPDGVGVEIKLFFNE
jgi:Tfp pilus assembly protein PilZ